MINVLSALWHREFILYRRHIITQGLLPIATGIVFFLLFSLPFHSFVDQQRWEGILENLILDTMILTMVISIYETTARFYWEVQRSNGMASLYEMGRFRREPAFFLSQGLISLLKGFFHLIIVWLLLLVLTDSSLPEINIQAAFAFFLLAAVQLISISKLIGLMVKHVAVLSKLLYIGIIPLLMLSGLYNVSESPLNSIASIAYYLPPYNWMTGLEYAFLQGSIDYGFLFVTLVETLAVAWVAATFFHLDGDR